MDETVNRNGWPILENDDAALKQKIEEFLAACALGDPYSNDGSFAANLAQLPVGLRAMAATHWLDISLTLDSITWHFGNFGEPQLVAQTESGLQELGLHELASCFADAKAMMLPLLTNRTEDDGDPNEWLEQAGLKQRANEIDRRAWSLDNLGEDRSVIYEAWIHYTRQHPERVFGTT